MCFENPSLFMIVFIIRYFFVILSIPMYFTRASGIVTEPSAFWQFSSIAATVLPTASPEPLMCAHIQVLMPCLS